MEMIERGFIETIEGRYPGEYRFTTYNAQGNKTLLRSEIEEIAQGPYRLVLTIGTTPSQIAAEVFRKKDIAIPVVFTAVNHPLEMGIISSQDHPGGLVTGVKEEVRYREAINAFLPYLPGLGKVLLVYNPMEPGLQSDADEVTRVFKEKNIELEKVEVFNTNELRVKTSSRLDGVQAIMVLKDNTVVTGLDILCKLCLERKIVLLASDLDSTQKGAAMGYGVYEGDYGVAAAEKALTIMEESRSPGSIPVTSVVNFSLKINYDTAERQGVVFSEEKPL
jgi:putative ABC transport system substrate-binding protein